MVRSPLLFTLITYASHILTRPVMRDLHTIGARLTPDQLLQHRQTHAFKAPCCLCSVNPDLGYTETVIVVCKSGEFTGEYVAECALGVCGYMGE